MNKETSSRVSTIAAEILHTHQVSVVTNPGPGIQFVEKRIYDDLLNKAKTLAGSCMSQDETAGQAPETLIDRLKRERQIVAMSEYLVVLDERLTDLGIAERSAPVEEIPIGNEDDGA